MAIELDHVFICCDPGGAEGDALLDAGLAEGRAHRHEGQGTANRRFFFSNAMLELLWIHNKREAHGDPAWRTRLWERWEGRRDGACPFGICWRPGDGGDCDPPFRTWDYVPPYLPAGERIRVAEDGGLGEPMWFFIGSGRSPKALPAGEREPFGHSAGMKTLSGVTMVCPGTDRWSEAGRLIRDSGLVRVVEGKQYSLELLFDGGKRGEQVDFRFDLPLILKW